MEDGHCSTPLFPLCDIYSKDMYRLTDRAA
jgi:hypothetical protein